MEETQNTNETQNNTTVEEESALLQSYKKLQETTVSKEKYEKDIKELKDKADLYLKAITEGSSINESSEKEYNIPDNISKLQKFKGTNFDYWKQMTELTDNILTATPQEEIIKVAGSEGLDEIIKVNEGMKQMIKDSKGSPDLFRSLYRARVIDSAPTISKGIESAGGLVNFLQNKK